MSGFLRDKYLRLCPYGQKQLTKLIKKQKKELLVFSVLAIALLIAWNNSFENTDGIYMAESILLALYLLCMEVPGYHLNQKENRIYYELLVFFSRVKHRYAACHHIGNAILTAADGMEYEVQRLAEEVVEILYDSDRREKVRAYVENDKKNRFMKLFLIQAYEVSEQGNRCFSENMEYLRLELMEEIYRRKKRGFEFSGYIFVAVTPFFMMPLLKHWGKQFTPELEYFYAGLGVLLETVVFCITIFIYIMIVKAKELTFFAKGVKERLFKTEPFYYIGQVSNVIRYLDRAKGKFSYFIRRLLLQAGENVSYGRFCFRLLLSTFCFFTVFIITGVEIHKKEKEAILYGTIEMNVLLPVADEEKREIIEAHILEVTRRCINLNIVREEQIGMLLRERVRLHNDFVEQTVIGEIKNRTLQYQNTGLSFAEIVISFFLSVGISFFHVLQLLHQSSQIRSEAVFEIRQFQSIILMECKLQGITILSLLEDMEVFSRYYRNCLKTCINSYGSGSETALLRLKEEGMALHESFEELADAFLSVDEVGIEQAFSEIESNRKLLERMEQLETDFMMENKKDTIELLSKIPSLLAVGGYFILPVFMYSLNGVYEVFELLEEMQI